MPLNLNGSVQSSLLLDFTSLGLESQNTTTPLASGLLVLLNITLLDGGNKLRQLRFVLRSHFSESKDSGSLLVDDSSETGLALDNGIWDTHLAAESWKENNELNWVDIMSDENQAGLLVLDKGHNVIQTILDSIWLLRHFLALLALGNSRCFLLQSLLFLGLGLWAVFVEELEGLSRQILVKSVLELRERWWNLEAHLKNLALTLEADIFWPLYHTRQVAMRLNVLTNAKVAWALLNERILWGLL